jgi:uncharacterized protein involved in outer membrane biogenesis
MRFTMSQKARNIGIITLLVFVLYTLVGFFILPPYLKKTAIETMTEQFGRTVSIAEVSLNPYALSAVIKGFEIKENDGKTTFVSFGRLYVDLQIVSLLKRLPVIREVKLEQPLVHIVRREANLYNFSDIAERMQAKRTADVPDHPGKPFSFSVSNIQIKDGNIAFEDLPVKTKHDITQIDIAIPFISNLPTYVESFVQPSFSASVNGSAMTARGTTKVFSDSFETSFDIALNDIDIPYYLAYAPAKLNLKVTSGKLDVAMKLAYRQYANRSPLLVLAGETRVKGLTARIKGFDGDFLTIPHLTIKDISFDLGAKKMEIDSLVTEQGSISFERTAEKRLNVASIVGAASAEDGAKSENASSQAVPWTILLKSLIMDGYSVKITDHSLAEPFNLILNKIVFKAENISTAMDSKGSFDLSLRVGQKGNVSADGDFTVDPPAVDLALDLKNIPLRPMQPLLAQRTQLLLATGAMSISGTLKARQDVTAGLNAAFNGQLRINNISLRDKTTAEELLAWDTLYLGRMDVRFAPLFVHIPEIDLSRFSSRIIVDADRKINLQDVFEKPAPAEDSAVPSGPAPQSADAVQVEQKEPAKKRTIRIDNIILQDGTVNFTDESIRPRFSTNLLNINGHVSGLSSDENTVGLLQLSGKYDSYAPLEVTGKINPLRSDLYVELTSTFKDMDLTSVSPYAGRYAGYTIQKGKLSFHLDYLIVKDKLDAKNSIYLDQFTFGDRIESAEATKLPVRLAVSLLKDRSGEIALDIPVSGKLNDPKFSVGGVVLKVIVNLLVKAATSPFALLGAVFGGGEELGYAEFDDGSAALTEATKKKLDIIGKALYDRPALKMDITGHAAPEKDREGLKHILLLQKIKARKIRALLKTEGTTTSLDSVAVTPEEYPVYLKQVYKEEKFPKPRNIIGIAKDLPVPDMERLLLANLKVTDDDLKVLAGERARTVRDYLLQSKQIDPERLYVVETKSLEVEKKEGAKDSRADFSLK